MTSHSIFGRILQWLPLGVILIGWGIIASLQLVDAFLFPGPLSVFEQLITLFSTNTQDILDTVLKMSIAVITGSFIGFVIGILLYRFEWLYVSISPLLDFFRSIPATALFPLFLLFFGIGDPTNIVLSVWIGALYLSLHVSKGLRSTTETAVLMAKSLKKSEWDIVYHVRIKEALPVIFVGLRTAISLTIVVVIVTEMFVGTTSGIGKMLIDASYSYNIPKLYAGIILIGLIGYFLNVGIIHFEKRIVHWQGK